MEKKETKKPKRDEFYSGTGRRKRAVARVWLWAKAGEFTVDGKPLKEAYVKEDDQKYILSPFFANATPPAKFTVSVKVQGGGFSAQKDAIVMGLSRALVEFDKELRPALKKRGYLTRDPREKERKKYYHLKARKSPQYSKR
ncbi:MAG: 30S ribosomal protein S9 [bacterium]